MIRLFLLLLLLLACPLGVGAQQQTQTIPTSSLVFIAQDAIESMLDRSDGSEYQLECLTRLPESIVLPVGILEMEPEIVGKIRYGSPVQVKVAVNINGQRQMNVITVWRVKKFIDVLVAAKDLPSRSVLTDADVTFERREVVRFEEVLFDPGDVVGLELKRPLTAGSIITRSSLTKSFLIKPGDNLTIISKSGSVMVKVPGQALQGGAIGDVIRVRNISSGKSFLARVEDAQTVVVTSGV